VPVESKEEELDRNSIHFAAANALRELRMSVPNLLLVVAFVLFVLAAFGLPVGRINLLAAGLALLAAQPDIGFWNPSVVGRSGGTRRTHNAEIAAVLVD